MEKAPWTKNHAGGITQEESWRRVQEGDVAEDDLGVRTYVGDILKADEQWNKNRVGGIREATGAYL